MWPSSSTGKLSSLPRSAAPDVEIFAIGDIHGRPDLLEALIGAAAHEPRQAGRRELVFLGDLVDRGPDSLGAIQLAMAARAQIGADATIGLMGNHETMMRMTFDPATPRAAALEALTTWMMNGGERVVAEFCVEALAEPTRTGVWPCCARRFRPMSRLALRPQVACALGRPAVRPRRRIRKPARHLSRPAVEPAAAQIDESRHWAWVRAPFLNARARAGGFSGYLVVHGHTPNDMGAPPRMKTRSSASASTSTRARA